MDSQRELNLLTINSGSSSLKVGRHVIYTREHLVDLPEIANWHWTDDFSDPVAPPPVARMAIQTFTNA